MFTPNPENSATGTITKLTRGIYTVHTHNRSYECKARGLFRQQNITPMVGDRVLIRIAADEMGYIEEVYPRKNHLLRPPVANVDQVLVVMSAVHPDLNTHLLDKYLMLIELQKLEAVIVINKSDIANAYALQDWKRIYRDIGYRVIVNSNTSQENRALFMSLLQNKITVITGPSGVGKSSLLNMLNPGLSLNVSEISRKTKRGRHTTRHTEFVQVAPDSFVMDTPGFSSLNLNFVDGKEALRLSFREIRDASIHCRFLDCQHVNEPDCHVKREVENGHIAESRYQSYLSFLEELEEQRRY